MKHFYIVTNPIKDNDNAVARQVQEALCKVSSEISAVIGNPVLELEKLPEDTDCLIVLGGDGTVLMAAKAILGKNIPMIGVNLGAVGYLTEVEPSGLDEAARKLVCDEYMLEDRMMLGGYVQREDGQTDLQHALNDIVLTRRGDLQVIGYRIHVNGMYLNDFYADGVIISSPTGSTGYNLSAGGSIVEPSAKLIVMTPVCPHTLNTRSIILSPEDKIEIEILPPKGEKPVEVGGYFDGGNGQYLAPGDRLVISKSGYTTKICKLSDVSFLEILHQKISE